ncbi:MAG: fasciclin domain-containing protein [Chlorobi bacterium]|nr:fasciclin domain-containing protein [Chlorobiota bacterium]
MKKNYLLFGLAILTISLSSCTNQEKETSETSNATKIELKGQSAVDDGVSAKNILQIAMGSADHTTLVAGVKAAGLEDVLANNGPLTVFAPTNEAFNNLPEGTLDFLLKPENKSLLKRTITFHAAPGTYKGAQLRDGMMLYMATGHYVKVEVKDDGTYVNGAKILATIDAANGVVHVVDKVFVLPEKK